MDRLEETTNSVTVNPENFLGNSLLASVLNEYEKRVLYSEVQYHMRCE